MNQKPTLTIQVESTGEPSEWGPEDIYGTLLDEHGSPLWSHFSSSRGYLEGDLTTTFTKRRVELETRYPDGYELQWREQAAAS